MVQKCTKIFSLSDSGQSTTPVHQVVAKNDAFLPIDFSIWSTPRKSEN